MKGWPWMNSRKLLIGLGVAVLALGGMLGPMPRAQADTLDELRERFAERYPKIVEAKRERLVGETFDGELAIVPDAEADSDVRQLVREENRDRQRLYRIIAEREETEPQVVARRNARRTFDRAEEGDYLRAENGQWYRKGEEPPSDG